jgi:hypothetical protein
MRVHSMACVCGTAIAVAALSGADAYAHPRQIDIPVNVSAVVPPRPDAEVVRARMLPNGYVVIVDSQAGFNNAGAITLYRDDGTLVSTLVGKPGDQIGFGGSITVLKSGNVLVSSPRWQCPDAIGLARCGAVTWISGTVGLNGTVDASNSLVTLRGRRGVFRVQPCHRRLRRPWKGSASRRGLCRHLDARKRPCWAFGHCHCRQLRDRYISE